MPFQSKAQQRWMFAKHPEMAERWAHETPDIKALPEHVAHQGKSDRSHTAALKRQHSSAQTASKP